MFERIVRTVINVETVFARFSICGRTMRKVAGAGGDEDELYGRRQTAEEESILVI